MPYKNKEQQREYQNERNRSKRESIEKIERPKPGYITWEELCRVHVERIQSWDECIKKAKGLIFFQKMNRLTIASIAVRACIIMHGGDRRSAEYESIENTKTMKDFAESIGLSHKTLWNWVYIKTKVVDILCPELTEISYTAAQKTAQHFSKHGGDIREIYDSFISMPPEEKNSLMLCRYLDQAITTLENKELNHEHLKAAERKFRKIGELLNEKLTRVPKQRTTNRNRKTDYPTAGRQHDMDGAI